MFGSWKWVGLIFGVVALSPLGGVLSLLATGTHFSVSSGLGFLALTGVSVEIGVIMVEYINQLRTRGMDPRQAAREGAELRLRPIMMTMLVATLGLLPAALSHDIGSDSQRPFAIVIVGGLIVELLVSIVLLPALYVFWAHLATHSRRQRAVLFVAVLFVAATQVCAGQTIIGSKRNHGFDIILLDSEVREAAFSRVRIPRPHASWEFPSDFYDLSETGGTLPENLSFPGYPDTPIPPSAVFPRHGNFFHFLRPIAR
jgi:hypothetical protein